MTKDEEIKIRMGFDATSVTRGMDAMMAQQKKYEADYVASWDAMLAKRDRAEAAANDASLARLKTNLEAKAALQKKWMEEYAAMSAIGSGSGGFGSGFKTAEQKAVEKGEGKLEAGLETAAWSGVGTAATLAGKHAIKSNAINEAMVLVREGARGAYNRMVSSFLRLLSFMGLTGAAILGAIPIVGATGAAYWGMRSAAKNMDSDFGTIAGTKGTETILGRRLEEEIKKLLASGKISPETASMLTGHLGSLSGITAVQRSLGPLLPEGYDTKLPTIAQQAEEHAKAIANYAERKQEAEKLATEELEKQARIAKEYRTLVEEGERIRSDFFKVGQETPSLADLAGTRFTTRLNKLYDNGGRFDLAAGNGPFAKIAQDVELAEKQQMWDIIHGNAIFDDKGALIGGTAYQDRQRAIAGQNRLGAAGLDTPDMQFAAMRKHLQDVSTDIAALLKRAEGDGLKIADAN